MKAYKIGLLTLAAFILLALVITMDRSTRAQNKPDYSQLLDTIAKGESRQNYNAYYGNVHNTQINFTKMTVKEVLAWQKDFVEKGSPSSAVGKYQFIRPTLSKLIKQQGIDDRQYFSETLQDKFAEALLERRGINDYMDGRIGRDQFAHNLSKEWAALPKIVGNDPEKSYYEGDGLNKVRLSVTEIYKAIDSLPEARGTGKHPVGLSFFNKL